LPRSANAEGLQYEFPMSTPVPIGATFEVKKIRLFGTIQYRRAFLRHSTPIR
jgi:hypothetical protein